MSQYLNIHLRDEDGKFHYLTSYSRSTPFYQAAHAPYEKVREYTYNDFMEIEQEIEDMASHCDLAIRDRREALDFLKGCARPMDEVMEQFHDCQTSISELEYEKQDYLIWKNIVHAYAYIADDIESDCAIYMGIEISEPTEDDIVS